MLGEQGYEKPNLEVVVNFGSTINLSLTPSERGLAISENISSNSPFNLSLNPRRKALHYKWSPKQAQEQGDWESIDRARVIIAYGRHFPYFMPFNAKAKSEGQIPSPFLITTTSGSIANLYQIHRTRKGLEIAGLFRTDYALFEGNIEGLAKAVYLRDPGPQSDALVDGEYSMQNQTIMHLIACMSAERDFESLTRGLMRLKPGLSELPRFAIPRGDYRALASEVVNVADGFDLDLGFDDLVLQFLYRRTVSGIASHKNLEGNGAAGSFVDAALSARGYEQTTSSPWFKEMHQFATSYAAYMEELNLPYQLKQLFDALDDIEDYFKASPN